MAAADVIYGVNPVEECLRAGKRRCEKIYIALGRHGAEISSSIKLAKERHIEVVQITKDEISKITKTEKHQGIVAQCEPYPYVDLEEVVRSVSKKGDKGFIIILDGITDPQNMGSIIRTAHLMGVSLVVIPKDNSAEVNATVVKASAGATEWQDVVQVTNIVQAITYIKDKGYWVYGAAGDGDKSIYDIEFKGDNVALVLGTEGRGLRRLVRESCDHLCYIPMKGKIGSYNVSVAGAIFMNEVARSRCSRD